MTRRIGAAALLFALMAVALPSFAATTADFPPLPRPRPDHDAQPGPPPVVPGQETEEQQRIRQGIPQTPDGDALMPPAQTAVDATKLGTTPVPVSFSAEVTEKAPPIADGLVWRIFDSTPDKNGRLDLVVKSEQAAPTLKLKPGDYVVHVAFGRAQMSDTLSVGDAPASKAMILDAGGLKLNAMVTGDLPIPYNLLHFDVFTSGASDADRQLVAEKVAPNDILTLNAGTYHIVSYFGDVNATVRADLRVEPGQLTDATLYQKAAQVSFKLVSDAGGEAIADVDWTVKSGNQTVFTNTGTFPQAVLQEGDYTVLAKRADKVYDRQFSVKAGAPQDVEVLTTVY